MNQKITNSDRIKQDTILFCNDCFGNKLISNNQPIEFSWSDFSEDTALLAKMLIPHQDNYGKYKRETIQKIAYETALIETKKLINDIEVIGPLPFRSWYSDNEKFRNIFISCTHMFLMSWPFYYFKLTGEYVSDHPKDISNDIHFIKEKSLVLAKSLAEQHFKNSIKIHEELYNQINGFYDNYDNILGSFMIVIK